MVACSPFGPAGELAAARHGALSRSQAAEHGLTRDVIRRMLRDGVIDEPVPGVLVARGAPPTWHQRLVVATMASRGAGVAGYRSAAALHGMDGYAPGPVELVVTTSRHIELPGLVMHRGPLDPSLEVLELDGVRCTSIARTLCDLGNVDPMERVRLAFEWAWRRGTSLVWLRHTAERMKGPRRRGPLVLLALLAEAERHVRPTESVLEVRVEEVINSLPGIVRQHRVCRPDGTEIGRVDFAVPDLRIAIEAHSREHHFGPAPEADDADREAELQAEGWIVRFVTDRQRRRPDELRRSLQRLIEARRRTHGSGSTSAA